jgi:hypothetical protein
MAKKRRCFLSLLFLCVSLFIAQAEKSYAGSTEEMTAEQLVAAHVKSIGNPALLAKIQSRILTGNTDVEFITGMSGTMKACKSFIISEGPKLGIRIIYPTNNYPGDYFAYDGKDVTVGNMSPGQKSPIAEFIFRFNGIMKEGMLGGILSTSWPLLDIQKRQVDMKYRKTKIEGRELYELEYHPKEGFGLIKVRIYFDPTSFRHVRTDYRVTVREDASAKGATTVDQMGDRDTVKSALPNRAGGMAISQTREDSHYTLTEKFDDFRKVGGVTLPYRYLLEYSLDGNGQSFIGRWTFTTDNLAFNAPNLDQKIFQAQK